MLTARRLVALAAFSFLVLPQAAQAASSEWHHVRGGSVRIVTSGLPDENGLMRGALQIDLKPGWKTYWLDPGSSGVPPQLAVHAGAEEVRAQIAFPAPQRFDDGYDQWAGYDKPVALALTLQLPADADVTAHFDASTFLGVCETICIPVQAELPFNPLDNAGNAEHRQIVASAFAALPGEASDDFFASAIEADENAILVEATLPAGSQAGDLFMAGSDTLMLGVPEPAGRSENGILFKVPVVHRTGNAPESLAYTLVTSGGAVSGRIDLR